MGPGFRQVDSGVHRTGTITPPPSRARNPQRLAAARHVHRAKARGRKTARAAVGVLVGLELGLARAKLLVATPVQRLVLQLDDAIVGVDGFREAEDLLWLAAHVRVQAGLGVDAIPAAAGHRLAV